MIRNKRDRIEVKLFIKLKLIIIHKSSQTVTITL